MIKYLKHLFCSILALSSTVALLADTPESSSFIMERVSLSAAGQTVASTDYETTIVFGQNSPSGAASNCNSGYVSSFGFWSALGDLPVPIQLRVAKDSTDESTVDLSWTGSDDVFQVFRSFTPHDVLDPANLDLEISECSASDPQAGAGDLIFYRVVARPEE
jgi:hypothetical protein